jgi:hypothetical protein
LLPFGPEPSVFSSVIEKRKNYNNYYNFALVLYGRETWSLTLREEHRLRVFENRVLRRIFGPKRDEVTGEWRKLHNEELRYEMVGSCSTNGGKPEGKRLLERPRRRLVDNIKMDLGEVGWDDVDWIGLG